MNVPNPPEFRLMVLVCQHGENLLDFTEMCTRARHRDKNDDPQGELVRYLKKTLGKEWFLDLFKFAEPEFQVSVIEENDDKSLRELFKRRRLGAHRIKELAEEYCDRVAALFGLPIPLEDQPPSTD